MKYLYHMLPEDMEGKFLYPLNELKELDPGLYNKKVKKYWWRKPIMNNKVPYLKCLWNDVLHMTAVHPKDLEKIIKECGSKKKREITFFEIPLSKLDESKLVVYLYSRALFLFKINQKDFEKFDISNSDKYSTIPRRSTKYFKKTVNKRSFFLFKGITHILYKGRIDITGLKKVKIRI